MNCSRFERWLARAEIGVGILLSAAALVLHWIQRGAAGGLWRDEAVSFNVANQPTVNGLWHYLEFDSYPPLFHFLVRMWVALGFGGDGALRDAGFGIGLALLAAFWVASRLTGARAPLLALGCFSFNPVLIRHGDSVRAYGLGCTLAVLAWVAIGRVAISERPDWKRAAFAAGLGAISVQCLYQNAALLLAGCMAGCVVAIVDRRWKAAVLLPFLGLPAALSLLPYVAIIHRARVWDGILRQTTSLGWLWECLGELLDAAFPDGRWWWALLFVAGIAVAATRLRVIAHLPEPDATTGTRRLSLYAAASLVSATAAYAAFLYALSYVMHPWYYLPFVCVAVISLDALAGQAVRSPVVRLGRLAVAWGIGVALFSQALAAPHPRSTNLDFVAHELNGTVAPGDLVLVLEWEKAISFERYYRGSARVMTVPEIEDHQVHRYDLFFARMLTPNPLAPVYEALAQTLRHGGRVWLVGHPSWLPPGGTMPALGPDAPDSNGNWHMHEYYVAWTLEASVFLAQHALSATVIPMPNPKPVSAFENMPLRRIEGWRD